MKVMSPDSGTSWLCPNPGDRERLLDMEERLGPCARAAFGAARRSRCSSAGPWIGWWTARCRSWPARSASRSSTAAWPRSAKPEYRDRRPRGSCSQLTIAASVALTGGPHSRRLAWLVIPVVTLPARFGTRGVAAGVACRRVLLSPSRSASTSAYVADEPAVVPLPAGDARRGRADLDRR